MRTEQLTKCFEALQKGEVGRLKPVRAHIPSNFILLTVASTSDVVICVACFSLSFYTFSPSICLEYFSYVCIMYICNFGCFPLWCRGRNCGSDSASPGNYLPFTFGITIIIRITCPCDLYPLTTHFYIAELRFTGVYIIYLFLL